MEFVRKIIDSSLLADRINLPESLKNVKVEVTILPFSEINKEIVNEDDSVKKTHTLKDLVGIANIDGNQKLTPELLKKEKEAWADAMIDKHGQDNN